MHDIVSRKNPVITHMRKLSKDKSYRDVSNEFVCDGIKLLESALQSKVEVVTVLTSQTIPFDLPTKTKVFYTSQSIIDTVSVMKNAQTTVFTCKMNRNFNLETTVSGTYVLLAEMQDPGNVGAVIRSAHAFGVDAVILTEGCADVCNPKVVRASMGSLFKQKVMHASLQQLKDLKANGTVFIGASVNSMKSECITKTDLAGTVIIIGNEGNGISPELLSICDKHVHIPIADDCESLNAAAAASILMWKAAADKQSCL